LSKVTKLDDKATKYKCTSAKCKAKNEDGALKK
jgi:hypothetical protein